MERIEITITGELPEERKYAILAAAQEAANELVRDMAPELTLTATVKSARPSARKPAPASPVRAVAAE